MRSNATNGLTADFTERSSMAKSSDEVEHPTNAEISRLAYQYYEQRGRQTGRDVEDWLNAKRELRFHYAYYE
jgi:hypothetical protein